MKIHIQPARTFTVLNSYSRYAWFAPHADLPSQSSGLHAWKVPVQRSRRPGNVKDPHMLDVRSQIWAQKSDTSSSGGAFKWRWKRHQRNLDGSGRGRCCLFQFWTQRLKSIWGGDIFKAAKLGKFLFRRWINELPFNKTVSLSGLILGSLFLLRDLL